MSNYLGRFDDALTEFDKKHNHSIIQEANRVNSTPLKNFFYKKYSTYPCTIEPSYDESIYISFNKVMRLLKEKYNHDIKNDVIVYHRSNKHKLTYVQSQMFDLGNGIVAHLHSGYLVDGVEIVPKEDYTVDKFHLVFGAYQINFLPEKKDEADELVDSLFTCMMKKITEASLQMICKTQGGFYLTPITIKKPLISDLKIHYGEEFEQIHDTIMKALKCEESHGLILLHGIPGSGKTHYIRYLIQEFTDKQLIYVPPDMTSSISTPEFFPFMLQNKDSILIIEDAENIIRSREDKNSTTQSVANLLNLSDGLLGDSLHQPIIATFNCELNSIDSALLRKGRLISQYEFGKLSIENSQKLSNQLGFSTKITEPMTLADIYGQQKAQTE